MMHIDRQMAKLFFDIKHKIPFEHQIKLKLASPKLGENLVDLYQVSNNQSIKTLIEDFMARAGICWQEQLFTQSASSATEQKALQNTQYFEPH